jgi:hypothetical protein
MTVRTAKSFRWICDNFLNFSRKTIRISILRYGMVELWTCIAGRLSTRSNRSVIWASPTERLVDVWPCLHQDIMRACHLNLQESVDIVMQLAGLSALDASAAGAPSSPTNVSQIFQKCFTNVSQMFHKCFANVSQMFHKCFKILQSFKNRLKMFHECFKNVSKSLHVSKNVSKTSESFIQS